MNDRSAIVAARPPELLVRLLRPQDGEALAALLDASRLHLRESLPTTEADYFTAEGQRRRIVRALAEHEAGRVWPGVIVHDGAVVGRISLNSITLGALRSAFVSYWLGADHLRRGLATRAVGLLLEHAFDSLLLHRVDAFTRPANEASRRVLERNGFEQVGLARRHTHVGGRWHDELLLQKLAPWDDGVTLHP
ncbi:ribosomal-protein-alanine N-acetyltransferase [Kitasatospora sp. MAP12-15]|uniref:GNAT family N-acetyltransferase n=1 Tax=unclassified Kitasatospora TaxID=2633591 RepID=UPI002475F86C|nr:GNAT family protein [Kitasatospora sp. MAP12-44]MDH6108808.1 ribosomal-protein-alanine N-acetyltransferase [Kitasatospora sp. MAP12-44]